MNTTPVKTYNGQTMEQLRQQLLVETDITNLKEIQRQLNAHLEKKQLIRRSELAELEDQIQQQMAKRVIERGDCFSNKDLLDYYKVIDDTINKIDPAKELPQTVIIAPTINDQPQMSREEKMQVMEVFRQMVEQAKQASTEITENVIQGEYKEINEQ